MYNHISTSTYNISTIDMFEAFSTNSSYTLLIQLLLILSGDIEKNPGPDINYSDCFSILHQNIRSIRYKLDYIKDNFLDFDISLFTESHLTHDVNDDDIWLEGFDIMFRKDNTAHSGLLIYASSHLRPKRIIELKNILVESMWIEIKDRSKTYLICSLYRPPNSTVDLWNKTNV